MGLPVASSINHGTPALRAGRRGWWASSKNCGIVRSSGTEQSTGPPDISNILEVEVQGGEGRGGPSWRAAEKVGIELAQVHSHGSRMVPQGLPSDRTYYQYCANRTRRLNMAKGDDREVLATRISQGADHQLAIVAGVDVEYTVINIRNILNIRASQPAAVSGSEPCP